MKDGLQTNRKTAAIVGVLFIIGTVAGILSAIVTGPIFSDADYLSAIAAHEPLLISGAMLVLLMGLALAMVPVVIFPILRKHNEVLALGYLVFRGALETITYLPTVMAWMLLLPLSRLYVQAGTSDTAHLLASGALLQQAALIGSNLSAIVFPLGAVMLYVVFYQSRLIPRWLSVWGLAAVVLYLAGIGIAGMYGFSSFAAIVALPTLVQEMVMAVWLIVKGFNTSAVATAPLQTRIGFEQA